MTELHSTIGASSAYRWMNCPGSVRLSALVKGRTSEYAALGTAAHSLAEKCLRSGCDAVEFLDSSITVEETEFTVDQVMATGVQLYLDTVRADLARVGGVLAVETSFSLEWLYPGMFGTNDASICPDLLCGDLYIYDYKNGRKAVSAEDNTQCKYYALGALGKDNVWMAERVHCTIVQPNSWGKESVESWSIAVPELYAWGYDVLLPAAKRTQDPDAPCIPGSWCSFCRGAALCTATRDAAVELLGAPVGEVKLADPKALTPEEIGKASAFFTSDEFTSWVKAIAAEELSLLQAGKVVPGRKLVETKVQGNRKWSDEAKVAKAFADMGEEIYTSKLVSPAQMEKVLSSRGVSKKEREARVSPLVVREEGTKTIVVSEGDSRAAVSEAKNKAIELF